MWVVFFDVFYLLVQSIDADSLKNLWKVIH